MRRLLMIAAALLFAIAGTGCSTRYVKQNAFPRAVPVTPEILEEISRELFESTETEPVVSESLSSETAVPLPEDSTVYWLAGGKVCHTTVSCRYIKDREDVLTGTLADARRVGKGDVCSVCYPIN